MRDRITETLTGWRRLPRAVVVLVAARSVNRLGAFSLPFLAPTLVESFSASVQTVGIILTAFGAATIPSRLAGGHLADRLGRKATVIGGLTGCAAAQLWLATAGSLVTVVCAVIALGLVFELYEPPSQAILIDVTSPADRPAAFGLLAAGMASAAMLAGLLATALGSLNLRWLFVADALTCLVCAALVGALLPVGPSVADESASSGRQSGWRDVRLLAMLAAGTVFATIYLQIMVGLPLTLTQRQMPVSDLGLLLTISAATVVAGQPMLRVVPGRRLTGFRAMAAGYVVLAVGLAGMGFADTLGEFAAATVVWSVGDVLLLGHAYGIIASVSPESARGRYLAVYGVSWGLAAVAAPLLGTQLLGAGGPALLWTTCAGAAVALAVLQPALQKLCAPPERRAPVTAVVSG